MRQRAKVAEKVTVLKTTREDSYTLEEHDSKPQDQEQIDMNTHTQGGSSCFPPHCPKKGKFLSNQCCFLNREGTQSYFKKHSNIIPPFQIGKAAAP